MQDTQLKRFELVSQDIRGVIRDSLRYYTYIIIHGNIQKLKSLPEIQELQKLAFDTLSLQDIFDRIAVPCIHQGNLEGLQYLILDCKKSELCKVKDMNKVTLLLEASIYRNAKIVQFLLENNSEVNATDGDGLTALHRAVQQDNCHEIILLLNRFGANTEVLDHQGLAPIHIAAVRENHKAIKVLLSCGVNAELKTRDGTDYLSIIKMNQRRRLAANSVSIPSWDNDTTKYIKLIISCISGFLLPKCNQQIFQDYIKYRLSFDAELDLLETILLFNCYFLTSSPTAENLIKTWDKLVKSKKIASLNATVALQRLGHFFLQMGNIESAKMLISKSFALLKEEPQKNLDIGTCNEAAYNGLHVGMYSEALELGELGLSKKVESADQIGAIADLHYNLAMLCRKTNRLEDAGTHFKTAYLLKKDDKDKFIEYIKSLLQVKNYKQIKDVCEKSPHTELAEIFLIGLEFQTGIIDEITALSKYKETYSDELARVLALDKKSYFYALIRNNAQALVCAEQSYALKLKASTRFEVFDSILRTLLIQYLLCGEYLKALSLSNEIKEKYPAYFSINDELRCLIIGTYIANNKYEQASSLMAETNINQISQQLVQDVVHNFVISRLTGTLCNPDERLSLLNNVLAILPKCKSLVKYRVIEYLLQLKEPLGSDLSLLDIDISILNELLKNNTPSLISTTDANTVTNSSSSDRSDTTETYNPVKVHEFYQHQKKLAQQALSAQLADNHTTPRWVIKTISYDTNQSGMVSLDSLFFPNYWAIISENLRLDPGQLKQFQEALQKGVCRRQHQQSGIKFIEGKIFELKIDADLRLWTSCVYRNPNSQCFIIFDKIASHEEIKRHVQNTKSLTVIEVPDRIQITSAVTSSSFFSTTLSTSSSAPSFTLTDVGAQSAAGAAAIATPPPLFHQQ